MKEDAKTNKPLSGNPIHNPPKHAITLFRLVSEVSYPNTR